MRFLKLATATTVFVAVMAAANAQNFTDTVSGVLKQGNQRTESVGAAANSATTPGVVTFNTNENVQISCKATAAVSETLKYFLSDGVTEVARKAVACDTTPAIVDTLTAGAFPQTQVVPSPTTGLSGVNTVTTAVIHQPK